MNLITVQCTAELGIIYAIMALGVYISFRTLNIPDLTVDGSFVTGAAVSAMFCSTGRPVLGLFLAIVAGCLAGCISALLHTELKIQPLLAGILNMLALYSINLKIMANRANIPLINKATVFSILEWPPAVEYMKLIVSLVILSIMLFLLFFFLRTSFGLVLRATGDNEQMVRALGASTDSAKLAGLALANGLVALSGALIAQYQSFADISMGIGMVVIGLASVIIGQVLFGGKTLFRQLVAAALGAVLYRLVIAIALEMGMPPTDLKLVSAVIVALALSATTIRERLGSLQKKLSTRYADGEYRSDVKN